nr:hypothetical protein CFP56_21844 [Quercus suber]
MSGACQPLIAWKISVSACSLLPICTASNGRGRRRMAGAGWQACAEVKLVVWSRKIGVSRSEVVVWRCGGRVGRDSSAIPNSSSNLSEVVSSRDTPDR